MQQRIESTEISKNDKIIHIIENFVTFCTLILQIFKDGSEEFFQSRHEIKIRSAILSIFKVAIKHRNLTRLHAILVKAIYLRISENTHKPLSSPTMGK
jgi:hypothetical protein